MGLFDFLKKKLEPAAAPEPVKPQIPAMDLNEAVLMEGFPRLTRFEIAALDKEYYKIMNIQDDEPEEALERYMELAKKGHPDAMNSIAFAYCLGKGTAVNHEEYCKWICRAAAAGKEFSQIELAEDYETGYEMDGRVYLEKDPVKSFFWYLRASRSEIYYDEYDVYDDEDDEDEDDDLIYGYEEEEEDDEPYSPNKEYVEQAQAKVEEIIASIKNGTFEGTPVQAQKILEMYN